jgi:hypothetical protein
MFAVKTITKTSSSIELPLRVILRDGVPVGFVSKFRDTRTTTNPWKAFVYRGEFVPGETESALIEAVYRKGVKGLRAAIEAIERKVGG